MASKALSTRAKLRIGVRGLHLLSCLFKNRELSLTIRGEPPAVGELDVNDARDPAHAGSSLSHKE